MDIAAKARALGGLITVDWRYILMLGLYVRDDLESVYLSS